MGVIGKEMQTPQSYSAIDALFDSDWTTRNLLPTSNVRHGNINGTVVVIISQ